jgi:hypothetical protein
MRAAVSVAQRLRGGARTATELPRLLGDRAFAADAGPLKRTPLYDLHVANGGKMVPFAGWDLPIQYKGSIMDSTKQCRGESVLFDVSHMCGMSVRVRSRTRARGAPRGRAARARKVHRSAWRHLWRSRLCRFPAASALLRGCFRALSAAADALLPARLLQGKDVIPFIESLVVGDIAGLADGTGSLSVMTNERGGIIDDTVITKVRCRAPCARDCA